MNSSRKLNFSGICECCSAKVTTNNFIEYSLCNEKFHAVNCSKSKDLCSASFLLSFKKSARKRTGFLFFCDICYTTTEINQVRASNDKLSDIQDQLKALHLTVSYLTDQVAAMPKIKPAEIHTTSNAASNSAKPAKQCCNSQQSRPGKGPQQVCIISAPN